MTITRRNFLIFSSLCGAGLILPFFPRKHDGWEEKTVRDVLSVLSGRHYCALIANKLDDIISLEIYLQPDITWRQYARIMGAYPDKLLEFVEEETGSYGKIDLDGPATRSWIYDPLTYQGEKIYTTIVPSYLALLALKNRLYKVDSNLQIDYMDWDIFKA